MAIVEKILENADLETSSSISWILTALIIGLLKETRNSGSTHVSLIAVVEGILIIMELSKI